MAAPSPTANVNSSPLAAAQVAAYYGPQTQNALRHSQYLADALRTLTSEGAQNIRSPGELGAKLLATAILRRANDKGQNALLQALKGDQDADSARYLGPLESVLAPPVQTAPPAASVPPPQSQAQAPAAPPQAAAQPPPQQPQPAGLQVTPQDRDALTKMIATEARGEGPEGMAAAGHVALNRLKSGYGGAKSLADVVFAPHQFEGIAHAGQLRPEDLQAAGQVADQILGGQVPDPTNGATNFLNPELQTQLGRQIPQWAQGQGQRIGGHVFFGGQPQPDVQLTAGPAPQGPLNVASSMAEAQAPQPYQVASNGPTPPPSAPGSSPSAAGAPPAALPPQAPAAAGGLPAEWPHWRPSRDEVAYVKGLLADQRTHQAGVQEALKMQEKMTQPVEATVQMVNGVPFYIAKDPTSGAPVMAIPVPREAMTQHFDGAGAGVPGAPAGTQFDVKPTGERSIAYQPPPGYQATPNGLQYQQGGPADPTRPQTPAQGYQYTPQGQQPIAGGPADPKAPVNLLQGTQSIQKELRPTIDLAVVARQSYGAVQTGYQQQNGAGDIAMVNGLQHLIDKGVVRGEDVNMQMKANGLSGSVGSISQYLQSGGLLTPETRERVLKTASELFKNVDATYRAQVMGYRQTVDNAYGQGSFDNYVMPHDTAAALGWADAPQGPGGAPSPHPGPAAPSGPAGTQDAALAEAVRRKLQLSPAQQARARQLGLH